MHLRTPIVIRSGKIRKDTRVVLLIFSLDLEISGVAVQWIHQNSKKWWLLRSENDFEDVLANFCHDYGASASKAVQKIAIDEKDYYKCSLCVITSWIAEIYQSITVKKSWLPRHLRRRQKSCRSCTEKRAITAPW